MLNAPLKASGSLAIWVLNHKCADAFMVWVLAQLYDRILNGGKATGRITTTAFVPWLASQMRVSEKTTWSRLLKAEHLKFLRRSEYANWYITGHRTIVHHALDHQQKAVDDELTEIAPTSLVDMDLEITRDAIGGWIHPYDISETRCLLRAAALVQGSNIARGVSNHTKYWNCARSTVQRSSKKSYVRAYDRFLVVDTKYLPVEGQVKPSEVAKAILEGEEIYQRTGHAPPGRRRVLCRFEQSLGIHALWMQLPNGYCCSLDKKVVRARRERRTWLREAGLSARSTYASARGNAVPPNRSHGSSGASAQRTGVALVPERTVGAYLHTLQDMLDNQDVVDHILEKTGATGLRSVFALPTYVHVPKLAAFYAAPGSATPNAGFVRVGGATA